MRGVITAGGEGTRLGPLTQVVNKHLLPVYSKPMIYYPIETLVKAGIKEILIVVSGQFGGDFIRILKNGKEFGLNKIEYAYQEKPGGIAEALSLAENFAGSDNIAVMLGDNTADIDISDNVRNFNHGCHIFLKEVPNPQSFGVPTFKDSKITEIIEKPFDPKSPYAVTGIYLYDNKVFDYIRQCKPSKRNELEISDVNNLYIQNNNLTYSFLSGFWKDAGSADNLFLANQYWYEKAKSGS